MNFIDQYRTQTIFSLLQAAVVIGGSLMMGTMLKVSGKADHFENLPFIFRFVRNWGFLLCVIPLAWTCVTIRLEREGLFNRAWTLASGFAVLGGLAFYMSGLIVRAGISPISVIE
jgi:hypothetical protein